MNEKVILSNWIEVPFHTYNNIRMNTFHEGLAARSLEKAGLLFEFANSFLVVASNGNTPKEDNDWIVKRYSSRRKKKFRCITTLYSEPELRVEKVRNINGNDEIFDSSGEIVVKHKLITQKYLYGDPLTIWLHRAQSRRLPMQGIMEFMRKYREFIEGKLNSYNSFTGWDSWSKDVPIDWIWRNCIYHEGAYQLFDDEWRINAKFKYILYHCIATDIIPTMQNDLIGRRSTEAISYNFMKYLFKDYSVREHDNNGNILTNVNNAIVNRKNSRLKVPRSGFGLLFNNANNTARWIYQKLPYSTRLGISEIAYKMMSHWR